MQVTRDGPKALPSEVLVTIPLSPGNSTPVTRTGPDAVPSEVTTPPVDEDK
jgi:hypothetical protein